MERIEVILKPVGRPARVVHADASIDSISKLIQGDPNGCQLEGAEVADGLMAFTDVDGVAKQLELNAVWDGNRLLGPVVFVRFDDGEMVNILERDVMRVRAVIGWNEVA